MMTEESSTTKQNGINWQDPQVPVGNSPPLPRWPIAIFSIAWMGWVVFLFAMALG